MQKGKINVQTENIFPIIKKFLYSDHEIFLRELVSNAVDATQKLRTMSSVGEIKGDLGDTRIEVKVDPKAKTLTVSDRGIGMTAEEVNKYINQIAFSSAEEWIEKYKKQENGGVIIGHFGLGFYSSFMVAKKVEIFSRSYQEGAKAVRWECDGNPEYILEDAEKAERGTDIVLHIADDSQEFLEAACLNDATGALALYKGPFAQGFDTAVGPEVEEWVLATRELLASVARDLYLRAAGAAVDNADRHAAWRYAQSAVRLTETHTLDPAGTAALLHELEALQVPVPDGWWRSLAQDPVEWLGARGSGSAGTLDAASGEHVSRIVPVPRLRSRHETNRGSGAHHN